MTSPLRALLGRARDNPTGEMPFLDHLEELRWRILWSLAALIAGSVAGYVAIQQFGIISILTRPAEQVFGEDFKLIYLGVPDAFMIVLKLAVLCGVILAAPVLVFHIWSFLAPALKPHEKRTIIPALYMGLVLFLAGVALAYFVALRLSFEFLHSFGAEIFTENYEATRYFGFVVRVLVGFGLAFELPVVILILTVLGLVNPGFLRSKRKHAVVFNLVLASMLSPGDAVQMTGLLMVPLILLYEFSILLSVVVSRRKKEGGEEESPPELDPSPYTHGDPAREDASGEPA